ncbi:MAG: hypothetical protein ACO1OQ_04525 [Rufibacter sp.]
MKIELKLTAIIFWLGLICAGREAMAQEKLNIALNTGSVELLNVGFRYKLNQSQIGASIGFASTDEDEGEMSAMSLNGDYFYHFGGASKFSERRPWYL